MLESNFRDVINATTMNLLRDNSLALTLAAFCLLLSAWLYVTDTPNRRPAVQLDASSDRTESRPDTTTPRDAPSRTATTPEKSPPPMPRAKPALQAQQRDVGAPGPAGVTEMQLSPVDWRPAD